MSLRVVFKLCVVAVLWVAAPVVSLAGVKDDVAARTAPVGELCMSGDDCSSARVALSTVPRSGEDIYNSKCMACHASGAANAPRVGDSVAWRARLGKGIDALYLGAINGFNGMPAKGLCMDCSDDEIKAAVDYMLESSE